MFWVVAIIVLIVVAAIIIMVMTRYYRKATRAVALVRTGAGGKQVVIDGGCLVLPFLHQVSEVNMRTVQLEMARTGPQSVITEDRLRMDMVVIFYLRVLATEDGISAAAQTLGGRTFRAEELEDMVGGKLLDAMLAVAASRKMDEIHENRAGFVAAIAATIGDSLAKNGLELESVSLTSLDQTPFRTLDENNAFNAVGMRRLAEVIAQNKKERAVIEADADVSVRQSQLEAIKQKLVLDQQEEQAQIAKRLEIEKLKADQTAEIAERQADADRRADQARISKERELRASEIDKESRLRAMEIETALQIELANQDSAISKAAKSAEQSKAQAVADQARATAVASQEAIQTERDRAIAERRRQVAVIRAQEQTEVEAERLRSEVGTIRGKAEAEADAVNIRATAKKADLMAEAEGKAALVGAENEQSDAVIRMKLDMHKVKALPEIVAQMVKPVEKIDGIRINQISGFGGTGGGGAGNSGNGDKPPVNQAIDGLMSMALQLPALQKIGREIGLDFDKGLSGLADTATTADDDGEDKA